LNLTGQEHSVVDKENLCREQSAWSYFSALKKGVNSVLNGLIKINPSQNKKRKKMTSE
jgi:hypothetical protein